MVGYRRNLVPGASYFFTVTLRDRRARTLVEHIDLLRSVYAEVKRQRPFRTDAMVVMPEHLHAIWTLPEGDADYSSRWRAIKAGFVRALGKTGGALERTPRGEALVWQRRFWEHTLRDDADFARHCDYIHYNPVKHGHVVRSDEWPYSTLGRLIERGVYPAGWAATSEPEHLREFAAVTGELA